MHEFAGGTPVFVDQRGRRRRLMMLWGLLIACLGVLYVALLAVNLAAEPVRPDGVAPAGPPPDAAPNAPPAGQVGPPDEAGAPG